MVFLIQRIVTNFFSTIFCFLLFLLFLQSTVLADEGQEHYVKETDLPFYSEADPASSVIFPLVLNQKLIEKERKDDWIRALEPTTGLVGWVLLKSLSPQQLSDPGGEVAKGGFEVFKIYFDELNNALEESIGEKPFIEIRQVKEGVAQVVANDFWLDSRRHENNAFSLFNTWKSANGGGPSILSFTDKGGDEKFIVIDGPHRPRYLKRQPN